MNETYENFQELVDLRYLLLVLISWKQFIFYFLNIQNFSTINSTFRKSELKSFFLSFKNSYTYPHIGLSAVGTTQFYTTWNNYYLL